MSNKLVKSEHGHNKGHAEDAVDTSNHKAHVTTGGKHAKVSDKHAAKRRDDIHQRRGIR